MIKTHLSSNFAIFTISVCMKSYYLSKQAVGPYAFQGYQSCFQIRFLCSCMLYAIGGNYH